MTNVFGLQKILNGEVVQEGLTRNAEALIRLLTHYLAYIGSVTGLINSASVDSILKHCDFSSVRRSTKVREVTPDKKINGDEPEIHFQGIQETPVPPHVWCVLCGASSDSLNADGYCKSCPRPWHKRELTSNEMGRSGFNEPTCEPKVDGDSRQLSHWTLYFLQEESFEIYNPQTCRSFAYKYKPATQLARSPNPALCSPPTTSRRRHRRSNRSRSDESPCRACQGPMPRDGQ